MKNERGAILIITAGFVLVFTMLGLASLHMANLQNETAEFDKASMRAFWLADGAVELARGKLPNLIDSSEAPVVVGPDESYDVYSARDTLGSYTFQYRWQVNSVGTVNGQVRTIEAILDQSGIPSNPVTSTSPLPCPQEGVALDCDSIVVDPGLSPDDDLVDDIVSIATLEYPDPLPNVITTIEDVTVVLLSNSSSVTIPTDVAENGSILVVDVRESNNNGFDPQIHFNGTNPLRGVLLVVGQADLVNPNVEGAVLIAGDPAANNTITGSGSIAFDAQAIDQALANGNLNLTGEPKIILWKEVL